MLQYIGKQHKLKKRKAIATATHPLTSATVTKNSKFLKSKQRKKPQEVHRRVHERQGFLEKTPKHQQFSGETTFFRNFLVKVDDVKQPNLVPLN